MALGIEVYDGNGGLIFDDTHFTMRVIGVIQVRDGTSRTSPYNITTPLAEPGVIPMILPMEGQYWDWQSVYPGDTHVSRMPIVVVNSGYITLKPFGDSTNFQANIDIAMVKI